MIQWLLTTWTVFKETLHNKWAVSTELLDKKLTQLVKKLTHFRINRRERFSGGNESNDNYEESVQETQESEQYSSDQRYIPGAQESSDTEELEHMRTRPFLNLFGSVKELLYWDYNM